VIKTTWVGSRVPGFGRFITRSAARWGMSGRPLDVLEAALSEPVVVRLKDGRAFYGALAGYDQHMNVVLDALDPDSPAHDEHEEASAVADTTVIRGDNVVTIET
jgi:small nuclear ribonucleoprotein